MSKIECNEVKLNSHLKKEDIIGKIVNIKVDRPIGSIHPKHNDLIYPVNYGYVEGIIAFDGEEQDVYILGIDYPIKEYSGKVSAIVHRLNDIEDKWIIVANNKKYTKEEIKSQIHFQEQYYNSIIID